MVVQIPYAIYLLGGVAVRVATNPAGKELAKRLIAQGFKKQAAYKTFKNFTTATKENLVGLITRAKKVLSKGKPTSNNKRGAGGSAITTAGGRGELLHMCSRTLDASERSADNLQSLAASHVQSL